MKRESVIDPVPIDPVLERPLLSLHAATNLGSFWKAAQHLLGAAVPNRLVGLMLQPNPILPLIARWTSPMREGFFAAEPLKNRIAGETRQRFLRISDLFSNRRHLMRSPFYRRYMAPQKCAYGRCLLFWKRQRLICGMAIMRTAAQGDFSPAEMQLLQNLYPQFFTALCRLGSLESERSVRKDFESFLSRLPLPTIILRWNLKVIYQNRAARDFCAVWEKGPEEARLIKAQASIPSEILDRCRLLKQRWRHAQRADTLRTFEEECLHHPRSPHLRATINLKHLRSVGLARPHFLIECQDLGRQPVSRAGNASSVLPRLFQLTGREQEVARLVCEGRSNKEIAGGAGLSVPTVKKHVHGIFRKLEVTSRSQLVALLL